MKKTSYVSFFFALVFTLAAAALSAVPAPALAFGFDDVVDFFDPSGFGVPTFPDPLDVFTNIPMDPVVETKGASDITHQSARVHGYVNPNGSPETHSFFEWGTTAGLGLNTGRLAIPLPSDTDFTLEGLLASTTYYYRTVGRNSIFTERGVINSFTTLPAPIVLGSCAASPVSSTVGNSVTWSLSATPTGGTGVYTYAWTGTDGLTSTGATAAKTYSTTGSKAASVTVTSGAQTLTVACAPATVVPVPIVPQFLAVGSCAASPVSSTVGNSVTWSLSATPTGGTGVYTYAWTGTDGLTSTGATAAKTYSTTGSKAASVTVTSGAQTLTVACAPATVANNPNPVALNATIAANPSSTGIGGTIAWTVTPTGGVGSYTYSWSGSDALNGTTATVSHTYYTAGTVTGTVIVTSGTQTATVSTTAIVVNAVVPSGGGGCPGGCGGGANPPTVVLSDTRQVPASNLASAAFVYLNQVPYTGIEDYIASIVFLLGLIAVSFVGSWYFVFRKQ